MTLLFTYITVGGVVRQGRVGMDGDIFWADQGSMDSCTFSCNFSGVADDVDLEWKLLKARVKRG